MTETKAERNKGQGQHSVTRHVQSEIMPQGRAMDQVTHVLLPSSSFAHRSSVLPLSAVVSRWTLATCLKYCMAGNAPVEALSPHMETFLQMMHNEDLDVKKAALLMVNAAVHHQVKKSCTACCVL